MSSQEGTSGIEMLLNGMMGRDANIIAIARSAVRLALLAGWIVAASLWSSSALAQETLATRDLNVWGRFAPGTWKQVRVVTDTLDPGGQVSGTTTTETKTTLVGADSRGLTLRIDVSVEVAGKRFEGQSQTIRYGYLGDDPTEPSEVKTIGAERLLIDGRQVPCQIRQIRQVAADNADKTQVTRLFLSQDVEPFVLRRETTMLGDDGHTASDQSTTVEVIALDMPYKVLRDVKTAAFERTIQKSAKGTNITLDVTCVDVPGGIVARTSKEVDDQGRLVRRSMLELVDYHAVLDNNNNNDDGPSYLTRRQARKMRRH